MFCEHYVTLVDTLIRKNEISHQSWGSFVIWELMHRFGFFALSILNFLFLF